LSMKPRESALRLKRFEATERSRKVIDLEATIRSFEQMVADLDRQIASEEDRTGVKDIAHFNYSTFAKAAVQRRDKLKTSIADLRAQLQAAILARDEAADTLAKAEAGEGRDSDVTRRRGERGSGVMMG
jgi:flagellar protein FliJ